MYKLIDTNVGISGTSLKGYITADYNDLVACFGEPAYMAERDGFNDKVWTEWQLEFENEEGESFRATIYDWKEEGPFASRENPNYNWHIGGDNFESQYAVSDMLNAYKSNLIDQYADGVIS